MFDLILHGIDEIEPAQDQKERHDGEAHRQLIGDKLRAGADAAKKGIL